MNLNIIIKPVFHHVDTLHKLLSYTISVEGNYWSTKLLISTARQCIAATNTSPQRCRSPRSQERKAYWIHGDTCVLQKTSITWLIPLHCFPGSSEVHHWFHYNYQCCCFCCVEMWGELKRGLATSGIFVTCWKTVVLQSWVLIKFYFSLI